jgi:hypothetical protein
MTDYWVSRERHFCNYCNVWMQGDKLVRISIRFFNVLLYFLKYFYDLECSTS